MPEFAYHDPEEKTFSVQAKSKDDIGVYKVGIIASIPGTQFMQEDTFTITVNPCQIDGIDGPIPDIQVESYMLSTTAFEHKYPFQYRKSCGYEPVISVTPMIEFTQNL